MLNDRIPRVVLLNTQDAVAVAQLHRSAINNGFLSGLGQRFTERMYRAILSCPTAFGLGIKDDAGQILGFIICAEDIKRAYRFSIIHHGLSMALPLMRYACRLSTFRRLWETLRYPSAVGKAFPRAEVLSIAVSPAARGKRVGQILMEAAFNEFRNRNIGRIKVAVAAANQGANCFYQHCGFHLATTRRHHNLPMNIYDVDLAGASPTEEITFPKNLAGTDKPVARFPRTVSAQALAQ